MPTYIKVERDTPLHSAGTDIDFIVFKNCYDPNNITEGKTITNSLLNKYWPNWFSLKDEYSDIEKLRDIMQKACNNQAIFHQVNGYGYGEQNFWIDIIKYVENKYNSGHILRFITLRDCIIAYQKGKNA